MGVVGLLFSSPKIDGDTLTASWLFSICFVVFNSNHVYNVVWNQSPVYFRYFISKYVVWSFFLWGDSENGKYWCKLYFLYYWWNLILPCSYPPCVKWDFYTFGYHQILVTHSNQIASLLVHQNFSALKPILGNITFEILWPIYIIKVISEAFCTTS